MIQRIVTHFFIAVSILTFAFTIASAILFWMPVEAQTERQLPAQTDPEPCVKVNTYGTIEIARCEDPDTLQVYYLNNMGFMMFEPY